MERTKRFMLQERSIDGTYSNPYRRRSALRFTAWRTISIHDNMGDAVKAWTGWNGNGLSMRRVTFGGRVAIDSDGVVRQS